jgi:hypothetical protein
MSIIHRLRTAGIIALLAVTTFSSAFAVENSAAPEANTQSSELRTAPVELNKDYLTGYLTDTRDILTSPSRWDKSDWLKASLVMGVAVGLYTQDDKIKTSVQKNKNTTKDNLFDDAKKIYLLSFPAIVGLGVYGYVAPDEKAKTTFLLSAESFVITGVFVQVLKYSTGRHRPDTGDPHDTWSGFTSNGAYHSFPSGDASSAFTIASVVASEYDNMFVPPLVYGISTLVALGRVYTNGHWSSDVFVGSVIGYFTGKAVVASHSKQSNVSFMPWIDRQDMGVMMTYRY